MHVCRRAARCVDTCELRAKVINKRFKIDRKMSQLVEEDRRRHRFWESVQLMSEKELLAELESTKAAGLPYYVKVVQDRLTELAECGFFSDSSNNS